MFVNLRIGSNLKLHAMIALALLGLVASAARITAQDTPRPRAEAAAGDKNWRAVAPGLVEPLSGEIKIAAPLVSRIGDVIVKPNDKVFPGQLLIRLEDEE